MNLTLPKPPTAPPRKKPRLHCRHLRSRALLIARQKYPEAESLPARCLAKSPDDPALTASSPPYSSVKTRPTRFPHPEAPRTNTPTTTSITACLPHSRRCRRLFRLRHLYLGPPQNFAQRSRPSHRHGQNLIRQLQYAPAFSAFDKASQLDPANGDAWSGLAFASSRTNQPAITIHALTMRSKSLPELPPHTFSGPPLTTICIKGIKRPSTTITSGCVRRQVPRSGMAGSTASQIARKIIRIQAIMLYEIGALPRKCRYWEQRQKHFPLRIL